MDAGVEFFSSRIFRNAGWKQQDFTAVGSEHTREILRKATQQERNIRKKKLIRRLHLEETEGRRLVPSSRCTVDMERQCSELRREMGRLSEGVNRGVAYESEILIVVKMGNTGTNSFPRTTELMEGIDYLGAAGGCHWGSRLQSISVLEIIMVHIREILCWKHTSATWQMWDARSFAWEVETTETTVSILREDCSRGRVRL